MSSYDARAEALTGLDPKKRAALMRLVADTALMAVPVVASFAMDGLTISEAHAMPGNATAMRRGRVG
jgi:hypothetical protein